LQRARADRPRPRNPTAPPPAAQAAPSERECDELITHAVALGIDEAAGAQTTTQADHEAVRRGLREDFMAACRELPRAAWRCAIAAPTLDALAACQAMPSSSTSNSNVAPGGIKPPAPLLP
jgi:hypothetical protein